MPDGQPVPEIPKETKNDNELLEEAKNDNDAVIDALESPLGQIIHASDPPPTSSALPPPLPVRKVRKKRFFSVRRTTND